VSLSLSLCLCLSLSLSFSLKRVESDTSQGFDRSSCCPPFSFLINFPQLDCSPTPPTLGFLFLLIVSPHPPPLPCPPAPPLVSSPQSHSRASFVHCHLLMSISLRTNQTKLFRTSPPALLLLLSSSLISLSLSLSLCSSPSLSHLCLSLMISSSLSLLSLSSLSPPLSHCSLQEGGMRDRERVRQHGVALI
jgi:hypothetical protein